MRPTRLHSGVRLGVPSAVAPAVLVGLVAAGELARQLSRAPSFDEGVYLDSLRDLDAGRHLGSEVFASQPPGFYVFLRLDSLLFPSSLSGLRLGFLLVNVLGCVAAFALARAYAGAVAGVIAGVLLATSAPFVKLGAAVAADAPAVSLVLVGLACLTYAWRAPAKGAAALATSAAGGVALAAACAVKLDAVTALVAMATLAVAARASRASVAAAIGGMLAVVVPLVVAYAGVSSQLWRSVVLFHSDARDLEASRVGGTAGFGPNVRQIVHAFEPTRSITAWLILGGAIALAAVWRRDHASQTLVLLSWPLVVTAFLLWQRPLFEHHVLLLAGALPVPAGVGIVELGRLVVPATARGTAVAGMACGLLAAVAVSLAAAVPGETRATTSEVAVLKAHSGAHDYVVATDRPAVAFLANRKVAPPLVDVSWVRLLSGYLSTRQFVGVVERLDVRAVLAGPRVFRSPLLLRDLARLLPHRVRTAEGEVLYYR